MATLYAKSAGGNWSAAGTWSNVSAAGVDNSGPPGANDDVIFELASGNVTVDAAAACRSLDTTSGTGSYGGTLTHNSAIALSIGDGTAGPGNVALKFNSGMTYTVGAVTSNIIFTTTSGTQQTIDYGGKTTGNVNVNGVGGNLKLVSAHTFTGASMTLGAGTLDTNGQSLSGGSVTSNSASVRVLTLGASSITYTTNWTLTASNLTFTCGTSTITGSGSGTFSGGAQTYNNVIFNANVTVNQVNTFANLTRTGSASKTDTMTLAADQTVTSTFTLTSNSSINRLLIQSNTIGTPRTVTANTAVASNIVDFMDITGAGAATWTTAATGATAFGDAGGNSGITFTGASTQTATGTASFSWSTHGWTSRVPLPQDDVVISNAFVAGRTITADMPRLGNNISFTGTTGTPTFAPTNTTMYGSLTLITGLTMGGSGSFTFGGRSATYNITSATRQFINQLLFAAPTGTYNLNDDISTTQNLTVNAGIFTANNMNVTSLSFVSSSGLTRALTLGTGTYTLTSTATVTIFNISIGGLTSFSGASATIVIANAGTNVRTFQGAGQTYGTLTYTVAGSTGELDIIGANTFTTLNFSDASNARTLLFTAGTTNTFTNFNVVGNGTNNVTIGSITAASHTLSKASGTVSGSGLTISRSTATGGAAWYAGATPPSVDNGNNSGWIFTAAPATSTGGTMLLLGVG